VELQRLTTVYDGDASGLKKTWQEVDRGFDESERRAKDSVGRFDRISRDIGKAFGTSFNVGFGEVGKAVDLMTDLTGAALKLVPVVGGGLSDAFKSQSAAMRSAIETGFDYNDMMKRNRISLSLVAGGVNDYEKELKGLRSISSSSEFGLPTLVDSARQLQIMEGNTRDVVSEMRTLANVAAALDMGDGGLVAMADLLARIAETGKASTREVRGLVRLGIPAFDALAEHTGLSKSQTRRLLDSGRLSGKDFIDEMLGYMDRHYPDAAKRMAETMYVQNRKMSSGVAALEGAGTQDLYEQYVRRGQGINKMLRGPEAGKMAGAARAALSPFAFIMDKSLGALESGDPFGGALKLAEDVKAGLSKGAAGAGVEFAKSYLGEFAKGIGAQNPATEFMPLGAYAAEGFKIGFADEMQTGGGIMGLFQQSGGGGKFGGEIERAIKDAAEQFKIDPNLIRAIIKKESSFRPAITSPAGAQGLMQLMPATAARYGVTNSFDPRQNIMGGTHYFADLLKMFGGNERLALAGYNAGEHKGRSATPEARLNTLIEKNIDGVGTYVSTILATRDRLNQSFNELDAAVRDLAASTNWRARGDKSPDAGRGRFEDLNPGDQLRVLQGLAGYKGMPGADLTGGTGAFVEPSAQFPVGAARPFGDSMLQPSQAFSNIGSGAGSAADAWRTLRISLGEMVSEINATGEAAKNTTDKMSKFQARMLQLGLDSKTLGDSFENNLTSAFDHIGEEGHNFALELLGGMAAELKHNAGAFLAGELRDSLFGDAEGKAKGLFSNLLGGFSTADARATVALTANGEMTALNTAAISSLTLAMQAQAVAGGGGGGGGWLSAILNVAGAALGGGLGGGKSGTDFSPGGKVTGFATGGSFMVGGPSGTDRTPVSFMATRGERVTVETPGQQRSRGGSVTHIHNHNHTWNISAPMGAQSLLARETQKQIERRMARSVECGAPQWD
jgi:hypothetical protein